MIDDPYKSLYEVLKTDLTLENATALLSIEKRLNKLERENQSLRKQLEAVELALDPSLTNSWKGLRDYLRHLMAVAREKSSNE